MSNATISFKKLTSFAPPQVVEALAELPPSKKTFTVAEVQALAARFADSEDFDSKTYLDEVLGSLGGGAAAPAAPVQAPKDPITAQADAAAELSKTAKAIEKATGMPDTHAS